MAEGDNTVSSSDTPVCDGGEKSAKTEGAEVPSESTASSDSAQGVEVSGSGAEGTETGGEEVSNAGNQSMANNEAGETTEAEQEEKVVKSGSKLKVSTP